MDRTFTLWIVEDDPVIAQKLKESLSQWSYRVVLAQRFDALAAEFRAVAPDLVILDLMLPGENGFVVCEHIRRESDVPILFLSSRTENADRILAMQVGGDDYMTKPVDPLVLAAKVGAMLRRCYHLSAPESRLTYGEASLDVGRFALSGPRATVTLSATELRLLTMLFRGRGEVVTREALMQACWQGDDYIDDNTLAVNMTRIRRKANEVGLSEFITTKRGVGYALTEVDHE
ncbi:MAG: response regulator transcription factor [Peptoniphilaceae bacterium]|nr:response regulator transcription factor [Peptoniphilaceae bacterium]MDY6086281.1 response regulator transcription factor [Peptoniphilaceae bacterium]